MKKIITILFTLVAFSFASFLPEVFDSDLPNGTTWHNCKASHLNENLSFLCDEGKIDTYTHTKTLGNQRDVTYTDYYFTRWEDAGWFLTGMGAIAWSRENGFEGIGWLHWRYAQEKTRFNKKGVTLCNKFIGCNPNEY